MAENKKNTVQTEGAEPSAAGKAAEELPIEAIFSELEEIIRNLEDGEISLEDSFRHYEAGMKLVKTCSGKIDKVEKQILVLNENGTEDTRQ